MSDLGRKSLAAPALPGRGASRKHRDLRGAQWIYLLDRDIRLKQEAVAFEYNRCAMTQRNAWSESVEIDFSTIDATYYVENSVTFGIVQYQSAVF
jgi:hypothetical protein